MGKRNRKLHGIGKLRTERPLFQFRRLFYRRDRKLRNKRLLFGPFRSGQVGIELVLRGRREEFLFPWTLRLGLRFSHGLLGLRLLRYGRGGRFRRRYGFTLRLLRPILGLRRRGLFLRVFDLRFLHGRDIRQLAFSRSESARGKDRGVRVTHRGAGVYVRVGMKGQVLARGDTGQRRHLHRLHLHPKGRVPRSTELLRRGLAHHQKHPGVLRALRHDEPLRATGVGVGHLDHAVDRESVARRVESSRRKLAVPPDDGASFPVLLGEKVRRQEGENREGDGYVKKLTAH